MENIKKFLNEHANAHGEVRVVVLDEEDRHLGVASHPVETVYQWANNYKPNWFEGDLYITDDMGHQMIVEDV